MTGVSLIERIMKASVDGGSFFSEEKSEEKTEKKEGKVSFFSVNTLQ